jgi:hypothetical protein
MLNGGQPRPVQGQRLAVGVVGLGGQIRRAGVMPHRPAVEARVESAPPGLNMELCRCGHQRLLDRLGTRHTQQPGGPGGRSAAHLRIGAVGAAGFAESAGEVAHLLHVDTAEPGRHLGLAGQRRDVPLGEPSVLEQLVQPGDVVGGQHRAQVVAVIQRRVDRRSGLLAARRSTTGHYRGDLVGVPVARCPPAFLGAMAAP